MKNIQRLLISTLVIIITSMSTLTHARYYESGNRYNTPEAIIYKHCDYRGERDYLPMGDFYSLKQANVGNDRVSSIIVPEGMTVLVYEHSEFGGRSYKFTQSVPCLPAFWNDRISSIRVMKNRHAYYDNNHRSYSYNTNNNRLRDRFTNKPRPRPYTHHSAPKKQCHSYTVTAYGGMGGFRTTDNIKDFKHLDRRSHQGKLCGKSSVKVELSKTHPGVTTVLQINNQKYVFAAHQPHDRLKNNWYRKYYNVNLSNTYSRY